MTRLACLLLLLGCGDVSAAPDAGDRSPSADASALDAAHRDGARLDAAFAGDAGDEPAPGPIETMEDLFHAIPERLCAAFERCWFDGDSFAQFLGAASCQDKQRSTLFDLTAPSYRRSIRAGRVMFDAVAAQACLDSIPTLACADFDPLFSHDPCPDAFRGLVPDGDACAGDGECGASSYCEAASCGGMGVCRPRVAAGEACSFTTDVCARGTGCVGGVCTHHGLDLGATCEPLGGGNCRGLLACWSRTCVDPSVVGTREATLGEPCTYLGPDECEPGLVCVPPERTTLAGTCQEGDAPAGDPCVIDAQCDHDALCSESRCEQLRPAGAFCGDDIFACTWGTTCLGLGPDCTPTYHNGQACTSDINCFSRRCVAGRCEAPDRDLCLRL
jgi:hypothetical protein